jgi:tRNA threonylcarbamoyl adenosine modification protein YeaZ
MKVLALETALAWGGAALLDTETGASYVRAAGIRGRLSAELFPAVEKLLGEAGWAPADVELVACSSGPGSFTGLRVGFAAVKGWYLATGCVVKEVSTFDVMASTLASLHFPAVGLSDARAGRAYYAEYPEPSVRPEPGVVPFGELASIMEEAVTVFGPDPEFVEVALRDGGIVGPGVLETPPDPLSLARLGAERYAADGGDDPETIKPIYLTTGQI